LIAGAIAPRSDFFSFGTNDLTQTALGFSRDDIEGRIVPLYADLGILERSPFGTLDADGVGELIAMALERGRAARPGLEAGICGEHGGDPDSIRFCHGAGLDYVSCSPFRVPIARVAAAQAAVADAEQRLQSRSPNLRVLNRSGGASHDALRDAPVRPGAAFAGLEHVPAARDQAQEPRDGERVDRPGRQRDVADPELLEVKRHRSPGSRRRCR
jgi:hypothetical protein